MSATPKQIVDAITVDIEALGLSTHRTQRYMQPVGLRADMGTWLVVWPEDNIPILLSTSSQYEDHLKIQVLWSTPAITTADSHIAMETTAAQITQTDTLTARLKTYGAGVPGLVNVFAVLTEVKYGLGQGMTWEVMLTLDVEAW